jgi:hypothetical protein
MFPGSGFDYVTDYYDLYSLFGTSAANIEDLYQPLQPDPAEVQKFSTRYRGAGRKPLIGISWATKSREVAQIPAWSEFLPFADATFVSLQYGEIEPALSMLNQMTREAVIHDKSVDQLIDMDRFAAQVASLDLVVTIDNTVAHAAGALGVPAIVLSDDGINHWPVRHERTPWCPSVTTVRRRSRSWEMVFAETRARVERLLGCYDRFHALDRPISRFSFRSSHLRGFANLVLFALCIA